MGLYVRGRPSAARTELVNLHTTVPIRVYYLFAVGAPKRIRSFQFVIKNNEASCPSRKSEGMVSNQRSDVVEYIDRSCSVHAWKAVVIFVQRFLAVRMLLQPRP